MIPYWMQLLMASWIGAFVWGGLAIGIAAWLGVRDARKERRRRAEGRKPREGWLGVGS